MSGWKAKRFWANVTVVAEAEGGWGVRLDGRGVKTPAKTALVVPTKAMAEAIAAEWQAQAEMVDPRTMPVTRSANAAIDKVASQRSEVIDLIAAYGGSDLLCYRAETPITLVDRQEEGWGAWLRWAKTSLGVELVSAKGVMHIPQDAKALATLHALVAGHSNFEIAALHDLVGISGSLVLGLAVSQGALDPEEGWRLSRLDEDFQAEVWGEDEEAVETAIRKKADFLHAHRFMTLCQPHRT